MDIKVKLGYIFVDLILPLIFGYFLSYQNRFGDVYFKKMMSLNILVFVPVLSTLSGWVLKLNLELLWLPIFGLLIAIVPGVTAHYVSAGKYDDHLNVNVSMAAFVVTMTVFSLVVFPTLVFLLT